MSHPGYSTTQSAQQQYAAQQQMLARQQAQQRAGAPGAPPPNMVQQQQQQQTGYPQQMQPAQAGQPPLESDGNDGLRAAKRRKPTDRSLPSFLPSPVATPTELSPTEKRLAPSTEALQALSKSYKELQDVERRLDWHVARRRVELGEHLGPSPNKGASPGMKRTLRVHITSTPVDQPWQLTSPADVKVPTPDGESDESKATDAAKAEGGADKKAEDGAPDFKTGKGIPRIEVKITGEVLTYKGEPTEPIDEKLDPDQPRKGLTSYLSRCVIERTSDPTVAPIDWHHPPNSSIPSGLSLTIQTPSSSSHSLRLSLYVAHSPVRYTIAPPVARLLDLPHGESDRTGVLMAMWGYIKSRGLMDEARKEVRCDAGLREICSQQATVPFHHLPEYVNRYLAPPKPIVLEVDVSPSARSHQAFDLDLWTEDPARPAMERVLGALLKGEGLKEIVELDEKIAADALAARQTYLERASLIAFATSPAAFLEKYLSSQARDLDLILSGDRGSQASVGGGGTWREEIRHAEAWEGEWVREAVGVLSQRSQEKVIREAGRQAQGQQAVPQRGMPMMQQGYGQPQQGYGTPQQAQGYGRR